MNNELYNEGNQANFYEGVSYGYQTPEIQSPENKEDTKIKIIGILANISMIVLLISLALFYYLLLSGNMGGLESYQFMLFIIYGSLVISWISNLILTINTLLTKNAKGYAVFLSIFRALFLLAAVVPVVTLWKSLLIDLSHLLIFLADELSLLTLLLTFVMGALCLFWKLLYVIFFKE